MGGAPPDASEDELASAQSPRPPDAPEDELASAQSPRPLAAACYAILFLLTLVFLPLFPAQGYYVVGAGGIASYALLLALVYWAGLLLDGALARGWQRFLLGGAAGVFLAWNFVSAWMLSLTATTLDQLLSIAGGDPLQKLEDVDLGGSGRAGILLGAAVAFAGGGALQRLCRRTPRPARWRAIAAGGTVALVLAFVGEQALARGGVAHYYARGLSLPVYLQLFDSGFAAHVLEAPAPRTAAEDEELLAEVAAPADPPHLLLIVLESFRPDLLSDEVTPTLARLRDESMTCRDAVTESIFTVVSWQAIFLDAPACVLPGSLTSDEPAWPLRVFARAGYTPMVSLASDVAWMGFHWRVLGAEGKLAHAFYAQGSEPRHVKDDRAAATLAGWIATHDPARPALMVIQLDSTHYSYRFPAGRAPFTPYPDAVHPFDLDSQEELDGVENRYKNAAAHVDAKVSEVLAALRARGMLARTAIAVVSDHGESFTLGRVGHSVLHHDTRDVPVFVRAPGRPARSLEGVRSPRDVWPTLAGLAGVRVGDGTFRGRSLLGTGGRPVLTLSGRTQLADLTFPDAVVRFHVTHGAERIVLRPLAVLDRSDRPVADWRAALERLPWREALDEAVPR